MRSYCNEQKQENILKYVDFYLFREKYKNNYWIQD